MEQQQQGTQQIRCKECGKILSSVNELREHEKTHKGQTQQGGQRSSQQAGGGQS